MVAAVDADCPSSMMISFQNAGMVGLDETWGNSKEFEAR
ncbi:hypothetical protein MEA186_26139 [Mesorhizobium amorphae CCNWGS0123]|uniref:Uncharacterized protein n=1 Tax=Mesorhizobium amorphae CCNWGS0123 TaxID=1082933 RepID=G6YGW5_9HYPH|nr:hypothetical protein MEA186_26139 [Mesorhizobium amorphae CCNWGS0123]